MVPNTERRFLSGEGWRLFEGGRLFQILSLRRGAYLKLGANSSIYGMLSFFLE